MAFKIYLVQKIGKKILIIFFFFSFILTTISTGVVLYASYTSDKEQIQKNAKEILDSQIDTLTQVLWNMDESLAEISLKSLSKNPSFSFIGLYSENNRLFASAGDVNAHNNNIITIPLYFNTFGDTKTKIGTLKAYTSTSLALKQVQDSFLNILLIQGIKTIFTSFIFLLIIYHVIIRHISAITNNILATNDGSELKPYRPLLLERKHCDDELQLLVNTMNKRGEQRNKNLSHLKKEKKKLHKEIKLRTKAENKMLDSHKQLLYVMNSLTSAVFSCSKDGKVLFMNHAAQKLLSHHDVISSTTDMNLYLNKIIRFTLTEDTESSPIDICKIAKDSNLVSKLHAFYIPIIKEKTPLPVDLTVIPTIVNNTTKQAGFITVISDKTDSIKLEEMSYIARHDFLTKLYNRLYIAKETTEKLKNIQNNQEYSLAIMDLDGFKNVNDTCGHNAGDELLKLIAKTIPLALSKTDTLARIGGDEFCVLFHSDINVSKKKSNQIITSIEALNFTFDDHLLPISCSIGITEIQPSDHSFEMVMSRADQACYEAKRAGKGQVKLYGEKNNISKIKALA